MAAVRPNRLSAFVLFVAVAGAPLPFGSTSPTAIALWCLFLAFGLLLASPRGLIAGHWAVFAGLVVLMAAYGFVLHEQLATRPWVAAPNPIWAEASAALGRLLEPSVSVVRGEPFYALGPALLAGLALMLGLIVGSDRARARQVVTVIAWAGVVYAVYGILALLLDPTVILWREKTAYVGNLTATFINRNTAAAYFGSCAALWLLLLLEKVRGRLPRGPVVWRRVPHHVLADPDGSRDVVVRFSALGACLAAMFLTASRAGVLVSLLVLIIAFAMYFYRDLPRGTGVIAAVLGAGAVALLLLQVMGGNVQQRIDVQGLADAGRLSAYRSTLRIIADHPWFGTGLGTFAWVFPAYRSGDISMVGVWDIAHSTPLELAAELGLPLAGLVAIAWLVALGILVRGSRRRRVYAIVPMAALAVSLIALLHSCVDFSLQIPGLSIVVFGLLGTGLAQSLVKPEDAGQAESPRPSRSRARESGSADRDR
jgi:O-antigen ligase